MRLSRNLWFALGACLALAAFMPAQAEDSRNGLVVTSPNGYANLNAQDLELRSTNGPVRWMRSWNGQEWKFNPQWESLSQSWSNLTGSQTQDSSGSLSAGNSDSSGVVLDTPAPGSAGSAGGVSMSSGGGGGEGCWVWVDEDWQPTYAAIEVSTGLRDAGPMIPLRSTPFNRVMPETGSDYAPGMRVSVDYASLCAGSSSASGAVSMEGIRRINELHLGENGRYSFNNRTVLEKRAVQQQSPVSAAALATGQVALAPVVNDKGYRWIDRTGAWIDYNTQGQVVAYGDRNDNTVWLVRDAGGTLRGVVDAGGRVLFTLHYTGELLTEVRDYPVAGLAQDLRARSVKYAYDERNRLTQVTDVRGNVLKYDYDIANHIVKITDQEGHAEQLIYAGEVVKKRTAADGGVTDYEFDYDDANKQFVSKITGPETAAGRRVEDITQNRVGKLVRRLFNGQTDAEVRYDTGARSATVTNGRGFSTRTTRNEFEQATEIVNPDGTATRYAYSALNLSLTESVDEAGLRTTYLRDARGNLLKKTEAAGTPDERVTEFELDSLGRPAKVTRKGRTEANGSVTLDAVWQLAFDERGQIRKVIDPEGNERGFVFDRAGNTVGYTDPLGNAIHFEVDASGRLVKVTDPLGNVVSVGYDKLGNQTGYVNARGKLVQQAYDAMSRPVLYTNEVGGGFRFQYDAQGLPTQETDEDGRASKLEFDNLLRLTREVDALGNATEHSYQIPDGTQSGQRGSLLYPTEVKYPTFTQRTRYDAAERPTSQTLLNPNALGTEGLVSSKTYDAHGWLKTETDTHGKTRSFAYNAFGQVVRSTDSLGASSTSDYDVRGNLIQVTDAKGHATRFEYDRADRLLKEVLPLGQSTTYQYDAAGNLRERVDAAGNKTVIERDVLNRIRQVRRYDSSGALQRTSEYTWDAEWNLTAWLDTDHARSQASSGTLTYDDANRKTAETVTFPTGDTLGYGYAYSAAGKKTRLTWADGTAIDYGYSDHGELETVTIPGEGSISVNQFKWKAPAQVTLPGGTTQERTYDGLLNLESLKVRNAGQQTTLSLQNSYGQALELKESIRTLSAGGSSSTSSGSFTYDDENRLTQARTDTGGAAVATEAFTLDAAGNRVAHSQVSGAWIYDENNRLLQRGSGTGATTYAYDDAGNLTQKSEPGGKVTRYAYDSQNRLVEVRGSDTLLARYGYDPMGRRIWKEQYRDALGNALNPARRTLYLYADEGIVAEATQDIVLNGDGTVTTGTAPRIATQYGLTPDSEFGTDVLFVKTAGSLGQDVVAYYHHDHLGAPVEATDKSGAVVWSASYNVFGQAQITTPDGAGVATIVSNLRLPGQYYDDETGLHYNFFRYYDTQIGRYTQEDPIGLGGGLNRYAYVNGNPLTGVDPLGLFDITNAATWPTLPQGFVDAAAGFGDGALEVVTLGIWNGDWVRNKLDIQSVNSCSTEYQVGKIVGEVTATIILARARNPCASNSFPAATVVHVRPPGATADDALEAKAVLKPIADLKVGDEVLAFSAWKSAGDAGGRDGRLSYEKVVDVFSSHKQQQLVHLHFVEGGTLSATAGHPLMTTEGWRDAIQLKRGGQLLLKGIDPDDASVRVVTIESVATELKLLPVYNLEVANAHTYFVGADGVLAHNASGVYWFPEGANYYIGKAASFADRLGKHMRRGRITGPVCKINMPGSTENDRRIMEGFMYDSAKYFDLPLSNGPRPPRPRY